MAQLDSGYIQDGFLSYLKDMENLARQDERFFLSHGEKDLAGLARGYQLYYREIRYYFGSEFNANLLGQLVYIRSQSDLEIITTAATHAYLPLLGDVESVELQVTAGRDAFYEMMGFVPRGFWLPECGYFPGLEQSLGKSGFEFFFVDGHAIEGGEPTQAYSGTSQIIGIDKDTFPETGKSAACPYRVGGSDALVFGRNARLSRQVWSAETGYPGDPVYRDYYRSAHGSGLKYWRVTDRNGHESSKQIYNQKVALTKVRDHARDFMDTAANMLSEERRMGLGSPLLVAGYDTELFGHWWGEGIFWLEQLLREAANRKTGMVVPGQVIGDLSLNEVRLYESSWGAGGKHDVWGNAETSWMWDILEKARGQLDNVKGRVSSDWAERSIAQATKELMLMQSSDWFFMVSRNRTRDYAIQRYLEHYGNLTRLVVLTSSGKFTEEEKSWLTKVEAQDKGF